MKLIFLTKPIYLYIFSQVSPNFSWSIDTFYYFLLFFPLFHQFNGKKK